MSKEAITATTSHRKTAEQLSYIPATLEKIEGSAELRQGWEKYRQEFAYATDLTYETIIKSLRTACVAIISQ